MKIISGIPSGPIDTPPQMNYSFHDSAVGEGGVNRGSRVSFG